MLQLPPHLTALFNARGHTHHRSSFIALFNGGVGGVGGTEPPGNSPRNQSCRRTHIREALPSSSPGLKCTDSIFNQRPGRGEPRTVRLLVTHDQLRRRRPGCLASLQLVGNPTTANLPASPAAQPRAEASAAAGSREMCFTMELFRQFLPSLHPPPLSPHGHQRRGSEPSMPQQRRLPIQCCHSSHYNQ